MKLKQLLLSVLLLVPFQVVAQTTTISSVGVVDSDSTTWKSGVWKVEFSPNPSTPGLGQYYVNGTTKLTDPAYSGYLNQNGTLDSSGRFTATVVDNTKITPVGSGWKITVCPQASSGCGVFITTVAGPSVDLTSLINSNIKAPRFPAVAGNYGYNTTEAQIISAPGATYYDVNLGCQNYYNPNTTSWACPAGGGSPPAGGLNAIQRNLDNSHFGGGLATLDGNGNLQANVNTKLNVMIFGAKGDGVTDDEPAIDAACTAAKAGYPSYVVFFPHPPVRYLVSTLTQCAGVTLEGAGPGIGNGALGDSGTIIRGKPGQDIIHFPDPLVGTPAVGGRNWNVSHIQFQLDDSLDVSASFPHRWPGRWTSDGAMTNGSAVLTSTNQEFTCGDIGVGVVVKGAGVAGADLNTTIASFPSCNGLSTTVTLAATASTTVTNALTYVSVPGVSATQTIGNCVFGADSRDGNSADWVPGYKTGNLYNKFYDVSLVSISGTAQHNSCGFYIAPAWQSYGMSMDDVNVQHFTYDIVQATSDTNPGFGAIGQDYQRFVHMLVQGTHPYISYNGSLGTIDDWQLTSDYGIYLGQVKSAVEGGPVNWKINIQEFEFANGGGHVLKGKGLDLASSVVAPVGYASQFDAAGVFCGSCSANGPVVFNNSGNILYIINTVTGLAGNITNNGSGNKVYGIQNSNPLNGTQPTRWVDLLASRSGFVNEKTDDFIRLGAINTPYLNQNDLLLFPQDFAFIDASIYPLIPDTASFSGYYRKITNNSGAPKNYSQFNLNTVNTGSLVVGTQLPAGKIVLYVNAKCPSLTSWQIQIYDNGALSTLAPIACSTTYVTRYVTFDFSALFGHTIQFGWQVIGGEVDIAWEEPVPFVQAIPPYTIPATGGTQFVTGPTSATVGNCPKFAADGSILDSGITCGTGIANFQITTGVTPIPANSCTGNTATTVTGLATTSAIIPPTPISNTTGVVGWGATGGLGFAYFVAANTFNWSVCNSTASSITPGATITWNVGAK